MANTSPPIRTCVLRVGIKCCKSCQTNAKRKLLSVTGVIAAEYNVEEGLLTVTGDVNPTMLLHKLTKWGKKAEIVSVHGGISSHVPITREHNHKKPTKCCLLRCFGNRSRKTKIEPLRHYLGPGAENGSASPFVNVAPPQMVYPPPPPPPQGIHGFPTPIPYPPPYLGAMQQSPPYTPGMFMSSPTQSPPYFQLRKTQFPQMI